MKKLGALMMVGSVLLLASCDRNRVPGNVYRVSSTIVEGDLQFNQTTGAATLATSAWTGGAGAVISSTLDQGLISGDEEALRELARGTLAADGKFTLDLPRTVESSRLITAYNPSNDDATCTGKITVSQTGVLGMATILSVDANKDGVIEPLAVSTTVNAAGQTTGVSLAIGGLLYVDRAVTLRGTQTCDGGQSTVDVDASLQAGWNKFTLTLGLGTDGQKVVLRSGSLPSSNWVFLNDRADSSTPLSVQSLGGKSLSLQSLKSLNLPFLR